MPPSPPPCRGAGDLIVYDALIHASVRDGLEPARIGAIAAPHNDVSAMDAIIKGWRAGGGKGRVWIAVETLYSMDGDRAPLADLVALAARHDAMLLLDEAHATGVYGDQGRGLGARRMKARPTSFRCTPAARAWARRARWSACRDSIATSWSIAAAPSSIPPRRRP